CLAAPVLAAVGDPCLDEILAGTTTGTLALAGSDGTWRANSDPRKTFVLDAGSADMVVVIGGADGGDCTVATQIADDARRITTLDSTRPLYDVECATGTPIGTIDPDALGAIIERATVALAAELVGTARRLLDMSLAYAKERVQFGVAIGSFQVIQHKLVDMSLDVERAWSAVYFAAMTLAADASDESDGPDSRLECKRAVHVAKATAGIAAKHCAKDGIQIHGGIGFTWEHDLHLFIRRAYASEALLGTTSWHHEQLGDLLF
ncbi:MAG: acyl-CoA dehydrogenase, partial [Acidimicrobiia bacterium]|nr:acyl-CoA dehydrogenase [Acidimicrobiia bacterium]